MSAAERSNGRSAPGVTEVGRLGAAQGCRYVLQVDLPGGVAPAVHAQVDAALRQVARDLLAAIPTADSRVEVLTSVGAATGKAPGSGVRTGTSQLFRRLELPVLEVHVDARRVFVGDELVQLAFKEFEILCLLLGRPGEVVGREEIAACLGDGVEQPAPRTIDVHVHRIRTKLAATGDCISTVRGLGYRCNASPAVIVA